MIIKREMRSERAVGDNSVIQNTSKIKSKLSMTFLLSKQGRNQSVGIRDGLPTRDVLVY